MTPFFSLRSVLHVSGVLGGFYNGVSGVRHGHCILGLIWGDFKEDEDLCRPRISIHAIPAVREDQTKQETPVYP